MDEKDKDKPTVQTETREVITEAEVPQIIEEGPTLPQILTAAYVERFEKGIEIYKRFVSACYRLTRESHWVNHGTAEKPRFSLQGPGAEALMNPLGISYDEPQVKRELVDGEDGRKFYRYWVQGFMESAALSRRGFYYGYCDSRDPFFNARPGWKPETGEGDVKKAAVTNWLVNGVSRVAGLRDPDPEFLAKAGLDVSKITTIDYKGGKTPQGSNEPITEPQLKRLWAICKQNGVDAAAIREAVKKKYELPAAPETDEDLQRAIKKADYQALCEAVELGAFKKANGASKAG
jgi:hypothetical protein